LKEHGLRVGVTSRVEYEERRESQVRSVKEVGRRGFGDSERADCPSPLRLLFGLLNSLTNPPYPYSGSISGGYSSSERTSAVDGRLSEGGSSLALRNWKVAKEKMIAKVRRDDLPALSYGSQLSSYDTLGLTEIRSLRLSALSSREVFFANSLSLHLHPPSSSSIKVEPRVERQSKHLKTLWQSTD